MSGCGLCTLHLALSAEGGGGACPAAGYAFCTLCLRPSFCLMITKVCCAPTPFVRIKWLAPDFSYFYIFVYLRGLHMPFIIII